MEVQQKYRSEKDLVLGQPPPNGTGLLRAQVKGHVLLLAICFTKTGLLCLGDHSEDLCNWESDHLAANSFQHLRNMSRPMAKIHCVGALHVKSAPEGVLRIHCPWSQFDTYNRYQTSWVRGQERCTKWWITGRNKQCQSKNCSMKYRDESITSWTAC